MADDPLLQKVHELSDLELAVLLCLISREHCLISTTPHTIDDLVLELGLVANKTFGLQYTVVDCNDSTTLQDFASSLSPSTNSHSHRRQGSYFTSDPRLANGDDDDDASDAQIANFVIAKNLDKAPHAIQIQALELLRTRRIFTRSSVKVAPKQFVFIPVLAASSGGQAHVTAHLNDFLAIAHWHDPEDGFVNIEEAADSTPGRSSASKSRVTQDDITTLRERAKSVEVDIDVTRYQMNIISFLRMHRAVDRGITPAATRYFDQLIRNLAPLHKLDFVTPALVCLAARKIYLHRIRITAPEHERSMQWGSSLEAVQSLLENVGPEEVISQVLEMVTAPV